MSPKLGSPLWRACVEGKVRLHGKIKVIDLRTYLKIKKASLTNLSKAIAYSMCLDVSNRYHAPWLVARSSSRDWNKVGIIIIGSSLLGVDYKDIGCYEPLKGRVLEELRLIRERPGYLYEMGDKLYS